MTNWYQRTDEEGNEIDYDYESGQWADDDAADSGRIPVADDAVIDTVAAPQRQDAPRA